MRAETIDGGDVLRKLRRKAATSGLLLADDPVFALCARKSVRKLPDNRDDLLVFTADDLFA